MFRAHLKPAPPINDFPGSFIFFPAALLLPFHFTRHHRQTFPVKSITLDAIDSAYADEMQRRSKLGLRYLWQQTVPLFRVPLLCHTLKASVLMFGIFATSSGLFLWVPDILNTYVQHQDMKLCDVIALMHANKTAARSGNSVCPIAINANIFLITSAMGVVFLACYILNGFIINRVGKRTLLSKIYLSYLNCSDIICTAGDVARSWLEM